MFEVLCELRLFAGTFLNCFLTIFRVDCVVLCCVVAAQPQASAGKYTENIRSRPMCAALLQGA